MEHEALVAVQKGQAKLRAIRQARVATEQHARSDEAAKERLKKLMAENPCRGCGGFGRCSRDPECPRNRAKQSAGVNVTGGAASTATAPSTSLPSSTASMTTRTEASATVPSQLSSSVNSHCLGCLRLSSRSGGRKHVAYT